MKRYHQLPPSLRVAGPPTQPAAQPAAAPANDTSAPTSSGPSFGTLVWSAVGVISGALAAYHGGRRNHGSLWQTVKWGFLGGIAPVPVLPYAFVQGFAKPREDKPEDKPATAVPNPFVTDRPLSPSDPFSTP